MAATTPKARLLSYPQPLRLCLRCNFSACSPAWCRVALRYPGVGSQRISRFLLSAPVHDSVGYPESVYPRHPPDPTSQGDGKVEAKAPEADLRQTRSLLGSVEVSDAREERLAKNETLFRDVNEKIASVASTLGGDTPYEFVCECSTETCFELIVLTLRQYEEVRADGGHFFMVPAHVDIEIEQVVATHDGYVVVEKDGVAGLVAHADDPRP